MGYRSEVAIRCEEAAFRILKATCAEVNLLPDKCYKADDGTFVLYFDWAKWYDDYKDVSAIMHVLSQLDDLHDPDSDDGFGYKYLRLGESDGDTEERDNDPDIELWQIRSIDLPACADEIKIEKEKEQIMDLNFDFFKKSVERNFMKYAPAEYQGAKFEMRTVEKINGQRDAVIVTLKGAGAAPCLYIDSMYDRYKELDGEFDATMRETWEFLMKVAKGSPDTDMVHGLLEKSDDIIFRVVNTAASKELLSNCPHREFLDLSFVYYKLIQSNETEMFSAVITNEIASGMELDEDQLYEKAISNMTRLLPAKVQTMGEILEDLAGMPAPEGATPMWVITNQQNVYGASVMFYDHVLENVAEKAGDLYILPSSVHEVIVIPATGSVEELAQMVGEINSETVSPEIRLSNNVYYYSRATGQISLASFAKDPLI